MTTPRPIETFREQAAGVAPATLALNEQFWLDVRAQYATPTDFVHLEYGWYHPCTHAVLAAQYEAMKDGQRRGSHYKRGEMPQDRERARLALAEIAGASSEEVIVTRNATESLSIAILGLPLKAGDEIAHCDQDYRNVVEALEHRAMRDGVVLRAAQLPLLPVSDDEVVAAFAAAITPRTRAILITHLINHTGHVLPVQKLCQLARSHNLLIIVDAAHSFAHLAFDIRDVDCDYFAASLHKWLGAPLGTGLLYVRRDRIESTVPFFPDTRLARSDIRKLEHFGNGPDSPYLGLIEAIRWHRILGAPAKEARLKYLQRRWTEKARTLPRIRVLTPESPARHGAIGAFAIDGIPPAAVVKELMESHRIFVNAVEHPLVTGVRVTPGVCSSVADVDHLVEALTEMTARKR